MKQIAIDELNRAAMAYLTSGEPLAIEHEGQILGFFLPRQTVKAENVNHALDRLDQIVEKILTETGMTEEEFVACFDLSQSDS